MGTQFWVVQAFNGISYGALLFLVGAGLSLIFGVMRIVNLSHGSYFLLGGYVALSVIGTTGSWLLSIPIATLTIAVVGLIMDVVFDVCAEISVLHFGELLETGTPEQIKKSQRVQEIYLGTD